VNDLRGKAVLVTGGSSGIGAAALTKSAAQEYATQGIRVNALVARGFLTPMLQGVDGGMTAATR
jgi:NAD(P)-dependent dehydrogenase (short-subunit alcohol dehydrogenase family)